MKTFTAVLLLSASLAGAAGSIDPLDVGPDHYKKVFENEQVRVMEVVFEAGSKIAMHKHPDHFAYVLEGGSLRIKNDAGKTIDAALTPGQVLWIAAESHEAENTGTTRVKVLVTELKGRGKAGHPAKKKAP